MKKLLYFAIVFVLLTVELSRTAYAERYFRYVIDQNHIESRKELEVRFNYNLKGYNNNEFVVRPVLSKGKVEIFNQHKGAWIGQQYFWSEMPNLKKKMKIILVFPGSADLHFKIQNTNDASIYETESITVWGQGFNRNYISNLNTNIKLFVLKQEENKPARKNDVEKGSLRNTNSLDRNKPGLLTKMIKYLDEII